MSDQASSYHVQFLKAELEKRKLKNTRYSMRAFASFLDIHPSALSRILNGVQEISLPTARIVLQQLKMSDEEKRLFLASVAEEKRFRAAQVLAESVNIPIEEVGFGSDSVLAVTPFFGFVIDIDKNILNMNESAASWLKTPPRDLIGKPMAVIQFPRQIVQHLNDLVEKARASERPARKEVLDSAQDGRRCYEISVSPLRSSLDQRIYAFVIAIHDITDRKSAHENREVLLESEKSLRLQAETAAAQSRSLQELSAAFVRVESYSEITHIAISKLIEHLHAAGGAAFLLSRDRRYLEPIATISPKTTLRTGRVSIESQMPGAVCARTSRPVWNCKLSGARPDAAFIIEYGFEPGVNSVSVLPLLVHGHLIGVVALRFRSLRDLNESEKMFFETVADLISHTFDRISFSHESKRACSLVDSILHEAPVGILYVDRSLKVLRANDEFARIAKRPLDALLNHPLRRTRIFDELEVTLDQVIYEGAGRQNLEIKFLGRLLQILVYPIYDRSSDAKPGSAIEAFGAGVIVTEVADQSIGGRRARVQQILLDVGRSLNSVLGVRDSIQRFFRQVIPGFADVCAIHVNGVDDLADMAALHPSGLERGDLYARTRTPEVWRLLEDVQSSGMGKLSNENEAADSMICVPLLSFDRSPGFMTFLSSRSRHVFDDDDLAVALELAASVSIALRYAKRAEERGHGAHAPN